VITELCAMTAAFASCFSRDRAFGWFAVCLFGMMVRLDHHGITAFVRWLKLDPKWYNGLLHFFQASSWDLSSLMRCWQRFIPGQLPLLQLNGAAMMVLDGIKLTKEGLKMPGNKKLHQSSENAGKAPHTFGHHFGILGFLVGSLQHHYCLPVTAQVQEGVQAIRRFGGKKAPLVQGKEKSSVITLGLRQAQEAALNLGRPCMLVLDAYYASKYTFIMARECLNDQGQRLLHVVTKAKKNIVAYEPAAPKKVKSKGKKPIYGKKIKLSDLFKHHEALFVPSVMRLYGKKTHLSYHCLDLIWKPAKERIRFVLVRIKDKEIILLCSNLDWEAEDIIKAYSFRFKIEVSFKELKHLLGTFCYHFWCKKMPKLSKKKDLDLNSITDRKLQKKIVQKLEATERFVSLGCIAFGMLQILAIKHPRLVWKKYGGWLRTIRNEVPSAEVVLSTIRDEYFFKFDAFEKTVLYRIITEKQREEQYLYAEDVA
jgi:hypothetical protein